MRHAAVALLFLCSFPVLSAQAQQNDSASDRQAQQAAELAMKPVNSDATGQSAKAERRKDLEDALLSVDSKAPADRVHFYDEDPSSAPFDRTPFRVVAVAPSTGEVYRLSGFEQPQGPSQSLQEFNRLTSALQLSVTRERALSLAALFLDSAVPDGPGDIALDDDAMWLRLAVQNYYFQAYGDVWRALEAYADWWGQFSAAAPSLSPVVTAESNGRYRVVLKRLARLDGRQPEVQNWDLEVSSLGEIRVLSMSLIFPVHPNWLFYDFR